MMAEHEGPILRVPVGIFYERKVYVSIILLIPDHPRYVNFRRGELAESSLTKSSMTAMDKHTSKIFE